MSQYVYGKNSVLALVQKDPSRVFKIFVAEGLKPDKRIDGIYHCAQTAGVSIQRVPRQKLDTLLASLATEQPDLNHQGVVASVSPRAVMDISDLVAKCEPLVQAGGFPCVLLLDGVTDPGNFGAILRVADAAGIAGIILPKHHSAGFSPIVAKAASGAEQTVDVAVVPNLVQAMERLQKIGFWSVGAALTPEALPYYQQDYKMPTVLAMGNEGKGLSRLVREKCDFVVKIPMLGTVDSLNVATATAVLAFEIMKQHATAALSGKK